MRLSKVIENLYAKVYVGIVVSSEHRRVVVETYSARTLQQRQVKTFSGPQAEAEARTVVDEALAQSPLHYVGILDTAHEQGAVPGCSASGTSEYADLSTARTLCMDSRWTTYTSKPELDRLLKREKRIDFVFSPFGVLHRFFRDKVEEVFALFVLVEDERMAMAVFEEGALKYAAYEMVGHAESEASPASVESPFDDGEESSAGIALDDLDPLGELDADLSELDPLGGVSDLDDFADLDNLDAIEELEDFALEGHSFDDVETLEPEEEEEEEEASIEHFGRDYQHFSRISNFLQTFYADDRVSGRFVESVYIADGTGVGDDLKRYLEEELFLSVYIRKIDLALETVELVREEADHAL